MIYTIDEGQLLRVWSVISSFARIRKIEDSLVQSEILTNAHMLLTAFVLNLVPLGSSDLPSTNPDRIVMFDA